MLHTRVFLSVESLIRLIFAMRQTLELPIAPEFPIDAAILDLDGTLVDTVEDFVPVLHATFHDLDIGRARLSQLQDGFVRQVVGRGTGDLLRRAAALLLEVPPEHEKATEAARRAAPLYHSHYQRHNGQRATVFPGVQEGLAWLRNRGVPLACVTNKPTALARQLLASKGLLDGFAHVFGGEAFPRHKPDPLPLLGACEALRSRPSRTLMVGDSRNDADAADAAGCPVVLLTCGYNHGQDVRLVPALAHLDRLDELPTVPGLSFTPERQAAGVPCSPARRP